MLDLILEKKGWVCQDEAGSLVELSPRVTILLDLILSRGVESVSGDTVRLGPPNRELFVDIITELFETQFSLEEFEAFVTRLIEAEIMDEAPYDLSDRGHIASVVVNGAFTYQRWRFVECCKASPALSEFTVLKLAILLT